ncbi:BrnT family toxin [Acidithiobacillus sp. MC6.1]|nr:BrnT family toxin [Acidithiobacillus sp. MC6.1]
MVKLEWDADKAVRNLRNHGVQFNVAARALFDPYRIEVYDGREDYGEDRWAAIGYAGTVLLYVVYTVRNEETIRLISARKANEQERKQYRQANP